jgi:NitT/TauT family transport system substrate-binding protein
MKEGISSRVLILIIGLLLILGVTYTLNRENSNKWSLTSGVDAPKELLKIGSNIWPGYEPLYLARELGYYENSPVRLVEYTSATQVIRAYRNNTIHIAALTMDEVLLLLENGLDPRIILVMDISHGADAIVAKPEIKTLADLRGRKVGVESTALGAFFLNQALNTVGLGPANINIISSKIDEHERMFVEGKLDAVVTFEPVRSRLLATDAHLIFDSSQLPGEIVDVLVIAKDTFDRFPEEVETLLKGWFKALNYLNTRPDEAASLMARRLKISPAEVLTAYKGLILPSLAGNIELMDGPEAPLRKTAMKLAETMLRQKLLQKEVVFKDFFNASVLKKIKASAPRVSVN